MSGPTVKPLMNTHEVADYLRIKERKVYDLVAQRQIPCTRAAGKWLFPKDMIDMWLLANAEGLPENASRGEPPAIISGSHDPLLDWAVRESGCGLALLFDGSLDGLDRFARYEAAACGMHVLDPDTGDYNRPLIERRLAAEPVVALEWAQRQQGLILAPGNPDGIRGIADLRGRRLARRQQAAGSHLLLGHLLGQTGLTLDDLELGDPPLHSEMEVAQAVASGAVQAGFGIAAAARQYQLEFIPLHEERYDLLMWRRQYFEPSLQRLWAFTRSANFSARADLLGGYRIDGIGTVRHNGSAR